VDGRVGGWVGRWVGGWWAVRSMPCASACARGEGAGKGGGGGMAHPRAFAAPSYRSNLASASSWFLASAAAAMACVNWGAGGCQIVVSAAVNAGGPVGLAGWLAGGLTG
jgi:hypothetical protein